MASISTGPPLNHEQRAAVDHFRRWRLSIILGGPGTGKTTTVQELILPGETTLLCAPTGNAADRIFKATGHPAYVLSKILYDAEAIKRYRGANLIMDEASMISIDMARQMMKAIKPKRVVFVGDSQQLPCMEGFSVISTLIVGGVLPVSRLTQNHRQRTSALMRTLSTLGSGAQPETDGEFFIVPCTNTEETFRTAVKLFKEVGKQGVQMLAFTNQNCIKLNALTANTKMTEVLPGIHVKDRVVCTGNLYNDKDKSMLVANGTIGQVQSTRVVAYETGYMDHRRPTRGFRSQFVPARAMTIHKSQGHEYSETGIILLGGWRNPPLEFIYTALSRFKNRVYVVGTTDDIRAAFHTSFRPNIDHHVVQLLADRLTLR